MSVAQLKVSVWGTPEAISRTPTASRPALEFPEADANGHLIERYVAVTWSGLWRKRSLRTELPKSLTGLSYVDLDGLGRERTEDVIKRARKEALRLGLACAYPSRSSTGCHIVFWYSQGDGMRRRRDEVASELKVIEWMDPTKGVRINDLAFAPA